MIHKEAYITTVHYMVSTSRICDVHDMEEHYLTPQCKECCCALMVIAQVVLSDICRTSINRLDIAPVQFTFNLDSLSTSRVSAELCSCLGDSG